MRGAEGTTSGEEGNAGRSSSAVTEFIGGESSRISPGSRPTKVEALDLRGLR